MFHLLHHMRDILDFYLDDLLSILDNPAHIFPEILYVWLATLLAIAIALALLTYPPHSLPHRALAMSLLALPTLYAFTNHHAWLPSHALCDSFARGLYMWYAHMSHEVLILRYTPSFAKEHADTFRARFHQARKVLFAYRSSEHLRTARPTHTMQKRQFLLYHLRKMCALYLAQATFSSVMPHLLPKRTCCHGPQYNSLFRRLPNSLQGQELWYRTELAFGWCIANLWLYESHFSLFALLFVGTGIDDASEWGTSLFRPLAEAWSVRRYWGVHWHSYISASFSAHVKVVTRRCMGLKRGVVLRLVENTAVFALSGVGHGAVKWVQDWSDSGDWWVIVAWYVAQMLPIVVEGVVPLLPGVRDVKCMVETRWPCGAPRLWRAVGYVWVTMWFVWCTSKYTHTQEAWMSRVFTQWRTEEDAASVTQSRVVSMVD